MSLRPIREQVALEEADLGRLLSKDLEQLRRTELLVDLAIDNLNNARANSTDKALIEKHRNELINAKADYRAAIAKLTGTSLTDIGRRLAA
jgi:hypothetical protein